tara:strand:+ start:1021 stop:1848 length:828 start_codon:yes stop_codon:yes gene_type:complete
VINLSKFNLSGKTALITGAAGVLGQQHAQSLLEVGCKVILSDISDLGLNQIRPRFKDQNCLFETLDVSSEKSVKRLFEKLNSDKVMIDILINNAAINHAVNQKINSSLNVNRLEDFDEDIWDKELNVGLKGAFLCSKIFGQHMANELEGGVILNIASDLSIISPDQRLYADSKLEKSKQKVKPITYSVIKTGLIGMTKYLATYWAKENVRCNAISPGGIYIDQDEIFIERIKQKIPLGRMAYKDEYRSAIQFLCSDASSYMNGHNLVIDGGRSIW